MKSSWLTTFRRLAAAATLTGATMFSSAMSYAAVAYDDASDPAYADGWQAGDNGGSGFTAWNWDAGYIFAGTNYTYGTPEFAQIDDGLQGGAQFSNPHNSIGRSWAIGASQNDDGSIHIGRGFSLGVGETLRVVFDNPERRVFFKGYSISLRGGTGGTNGNICNVGYGCSHPNFPDGYPVSKMSLGRFEYFNYGEWNIYDNATNDTEVFDNETSAAGAVLTVSRRSANGYVAKLVPLGGADDYGPKARFFENPSANPDWIEFTFFNANDPDGAPPPVGFSDPTPTLAELQTDLYIRSMEIFSGVVPEPGSGVMLVLAAGTLLGTARRGRREA